MRSLRHGIIASWYNSIWYNSIWKFNQHGRDRWVATQAAQIPAGSRVLDVGAGTGRYRKLFRHCEYKAHDFGQTPELRNKYTSLDYQSDIVNIPVPDNSFDAILCTEVLEHVPEPIRAVHEMARIMRRGEAAPVCTPWMSPASRALYLLRWIYALLVSPFLGRGRAGDRDHRGKPRLLQLLCSGRVAL